MRQCRFQRRFPSPACHDSMAVDSEMLLTARSNGVTHSGRAVVAKATSSLHRLESVAEQKLRMRNL